MFGINDPLILLPYLLSILCVVFCRMVRLEVLEQRRRKRQNIMNTFTLSLIVIAYLLSLVYLGFLGYKKTTTASDYLVGGSTDEPHCNGTLLRCYVYLCFGHCGLWWGCCRFRHGYSVAMLSQYVCGCGYCLPVLWIAYPGAWVRDSM